MQFLTSLNNFDWFCTLSNDFLILSQSIFDLGLSHSILGNLRLFRAISGYLSLSCSVSGYLWLSLALSRYLRLVLAISCKVWKSLAISDYFRLSLAILGYLWLSFAISGYLRLSGYLGLSLAILGYIGLSLAISGYHLLSLAISGYLWLSLTISDFLWLCLPISSYIYQVEAGESKLLLFKLFPYIFLNFLLFFADKSYRGPRAPKNLMFRYYAFSWPVFLWLDSIVGERKFFLAASFSIHNFMPNVTLYFAETCSWRASFCRTFSSMFHLAFSTYCAPGPTPVVRLNR